jgi:carboxyl-terminal processing protease
MINSPKQKPKNDESYGKSLLLGTMIGFVLALVFIAGFVTRDVVDMATENSTEENYPLLDEVQYLLDNYYLHEQPDYKERQYAAIRGMLDQLGDRNTFFIDPPVARSESDALAGAYGGIGVNLQRDVEGNFVLYPFADGPAAKADIHDGDILVAVNGVVLDLTAQQDAIDQMLRGDVKDGQGVELTVARDGDDDYTVFIEFDVINVPSVQWRVLTEDERLGYIQVIRFTNRTPTEITEAISFLREANVTAMVLDLRNNSGGLLHESIDVASIFVDGGIVAYERKKNEQNPFSAETGGEMTDLPLVVLVNQGTASAAELVAGAIQDRQRGITIGQATYGKGTIQQIFGLSDTSSVHVTIAEWLTPNEHALDGVGLEPGIYMIPDENGRDIEIGEAILYLQQQLVEQGKDTE